MRFKEHLRLFTFTDFVRSTPSFEPDCIPKTSQQSGETIQLYSVNFSPQQCADESESSLSRALPLSWSHPTCIPSTPTQLNSHADQSRHDHGRRAPPLVLAACHTLASLPKCFSPSRVLQEQYPRVLLNGPDELPTLTS